MATITTSKSLDYLQSSENKPYRIKVLLALIFSIITVFAAVLLPFYIDVHNIDLSSINLGFSQLSPTIAFWFFKQENHWKPVEQNFLSKLKQLELEFPNQSR